MSTIDDGTGSGAQAKVGQQKRVHTHALTASDISVAGMRGDAFDVNSGIITLTTANESGILYIKNDEDVEIALAVMFSNLGSTTGGSGSGVLKWHLNPTGGTLISGAVDANSINRKLGDPNILAGDQFKGAEGNTVTSTSSIDIPTAVSGIYSSIFIIPKGQSFAVTYEPPTGNTSQDVQMGVLVIKNYATYTVD